MDSIILTDPEDLKRVIKEALNEVFEERLPEVPVDRRDYYTREEVAEKWQISLVSLWRYVKLGLLHPTKMGSLVRFKKEEVDNMDEFDLINQLRRKTKAEKNIRKRKKESPLPSSPHRGGGYENDSQNKK